MTEKNPNIRLVDLQRQYHSIKDEMDDAIQKCLDNTAFIGGKELAAFAENFAAFCNTDHCVPCGNGTDALEIGMKALGIGQGDEVIVPANSFIATAEPVLNINAEVVFCDVDPERFTIDPEKIKTLISPKTKAIIVVHLFGRMADMSPILEIAQKHNLFVIEDAAQAHGATYKGQKAGTFGHLSTFSFYPGKNLGAYGDAGAIVTKDEKLFLLCKKIANHGRIAKYDHEMIGRNSRMDGLQAAVLNVKLKHLNGWSEKRFQIAQRYHELLVDIPGIICPKDFEDEKAVYHLYVIRVMDGKREALQSHLKSRGISTGVHYPISLPKLSAFDYLKHKEEDFPVANAYMDEVLSLPLFPELEEQEIKYITDAIRFFFNNT